MNLRLRFCLVPSVEDAKLGADFEKTVNSIQERSSKNLSKPKPTKVCRVHVVDTDLEIPVFD